MNKINTFLAEHGIKVIIVLLLLTYMKSCSISSELTKTKKELKLVTTEVTEIKQKSATHVDLKIMGLEAEKRMIQATDRKMLDVQRQNAIEEEITKLKKSKVATGN